MNSPSLWRRLALGASGDRCLYTLSLARSIGERDENEWHAACGGRAEAVMDPRFLRAVEQSMGADTRFWNVVFRDTAGAPVAAAALSLYTIDGLLLAPERWKQMGMRLRRLWPNLLKAPVLLCGSPVSTGESHLRITAGADHHVLLRQLDRLMVRLARSSAHALSRLQGVCSPGGCPHGRLAGAGLSARGQPGHELFSCPLPRLRSLSAHRSARAIGTKSCAHGKNSSVLGCASNTSGETKASTSCTRRTFTACTWPSSATRTSLLNVCPRSSSAS